MIQLSCNNYTATIAEHGAELCSLVRDGRELIWQGDAKYWGRHAPILFPIVGKVAGNRYRVGKQEFELTQHGFARDCNFELVSQSQDSCVLKLKDSELTLSKYPFNFELTVRYHLTSEGLLCSWEVHNPSKNNMPCQIGGHPAFNYVDYPEGKGRGRMQFLKEGCVLKGFDAVRINNEGLALPGTEKITLNPEGKMALSATTFDNGVFILENSQCDEVRLYDEADQLYLSLKSAGSPVLGIWAPEHKDPPFVCIEPWKGRTDPIGYSDQYDKKPWINIVPPGENLLFEYSIA